ncbi:nucleotidyltransferase family protein [Desulfobacter vibrioformis]|uniref:nucleotidyltransferase family protein n=1 Tax=Desulfobacter vibrioformis TaxID=34031 RepID=UPI000553AF3B|nr:nucleotidyltransferase family protein [Desulfobacter vibrioformis]
MPPIDRNLIKTIEAHKDIIKGKFSVESMSIFGSMSKGTAKSDSDIDILIRFKTTPGLFGFIDLKQYLEGIVGRPVDLVTENALKKQLRDDILRDAVHVA